MSIRILRPEAIAATINPNLKVQMEFNLPLGGTCDITVEWKRDK